MSDHDTQDLSSARSRSSPCLAASLAPVALPSSGVNQGTGVESIAHFRVDELEVPNAAAVAADPTYVPARSVPSTDIDDWLSDVLRDSKSLSRGYFDVRAIEKLLADNVASGNYSKEIFSLATPELWHRTFLSEARAASN